LHTKSYSQHLRDAQYCGLQWRILHLKPDFYEQASETLPKFRVVPVRCNSKACPHCSRLYFNKLRRRLRDVSKFTNWRFFTLTTIHAPNNSDNELEKMENDFRQLRKKLKRNFPELKYIAVKELSPSGMWHIHGLWNIYIDLETLSNFWQDISGAYRCNLQKIRNPKGAVNYVFKYCYKSVTNPTERQTLYEHDKKKFTTSTGLFDKCSNQNPYACEIGVSYSVEEVKEKLYSIILTSQCTVDDFNSNHYPYFDDLIYNLFDKFIQEHPPNLFGSPRLASLGSGILIFP
jgi:hypothetical protein